jgi:hypothetical protein
MSRVLLIEPDRMLRHAFIIALFPEHQVVTASAFPDAATKDFDLLIVDAGALQEQNLLSARECERLKSWKLPVLWFAPDAALAPTDRDRWLRLKAPLTKDILRRAVGQCLGASVGAAQGIVAQTGPLPVEAPPSVQPKARKKKTAEVNDEKLFIELVDIVEEEPV